MARDALRLEGLDAFYGDSHVLHGVGLTVPEGAVVALLGRNGAGKTTCMSAIMGLVRPRGSITLFGERLDGCPPERVAWRGVGLVPQGRRVFPSLSVDEHLRVARRARPHAPSQWPIERVYQTFPRLRERHRQLAGSLSGGEQQMLAIGRALVGNPLLLLMDEPSEGLAPLIVAEVARVITLLCREGLSILLVEQNVRMALETADCVAILTTGRCVFEGKVAALNARPELVEQNLGVVGAPAHA